MKGLRERVGMKAGQEALDERDLPQGCSPPPDTRDLDSDTKSITAPVEFLQVKCFDNICSPRSRRAVLILHISSRLTMQREKSANTDQLQYSNTCPQQT